LPDKRVVEIVKLARRNYTITILGGCPTPPKAPPPTSFGRDSLFNVVLYQARNATSGKTGISHKSDFQAVFALFHHYFVACFFNGGIKFFRLPKSCLLYTDFATSPLLLSI
jgi:hypothetical protein